MADQQLRNELTEIEDRARALRNGLRACPEPLGREALELADLVTQLTQVIREQMVR